MKCFYYLSRTLKSTREISEDLHEVGIKDFYIHVVSKDESGLRQQQIHSSNYLETLDVVRVGILGAAAGFVTGLIGVELLRYFQPFGTGVPEFIYLIVVAFATLFGAWEGGLIGIGVENGKLARFHEDIDAGLYLMLVYARTQKEKLVRDMMGARHADAELVGVDRYFLNPFRRVVRLSRADDGRENALQKG
jgi:hypothetical protein